MSVTPPGLILELIGHFDIYAHICTLYNNNGAEESDHRSRILQITEIGKPIKESIKTAA